MPEIQSMDPPPGLCDFHKIAWKGDVVALRFVMDLCKLSINYQDIYGNTAMHYAVVNGHWHFVQGCIEEFQANLLLLNNGNQSVLSVLNQAKLALIPDDKRQATTEADATGTTATS